MTILAPETFDSFGNLSLVVLATKPTNLASIPVAAITAGKNITCHSVGDWWATASVNKVTRQRKMCEVQVAESLGTTTHQLPALQYTYNPQTVAATGGAGNEAYDVLVPGSTVYLVQRLGKSGKSALATGDAVRTFAVKLGPRVPGASAEDEGGEFTITQELGFAPGFSAPVDGVVAAT